jgi:hypothetical protein
MAIPSILTAFSNEWVEDRRYLRKLLEESKAVVDALAAPAARGLIDVPAPMHNATAEDVVRGFQARQDRVQIFHFGGACE